MSIREKILDNPRASGGVAAGLIAVAAVLMFTQLRPAAPVVVSAAGKAFYTVDNGATWFADTTPRIIPFTHDGKPAVRAYLYTRSSGGEPFVGYLMRHTEAGVATLMREEKEREATLNALKSVPGGYSASSGAQLPTVHYDDRRLQEVKSPKTGGDWVGRLEPAGIALADVKSPDGGTAVPVEP